MRILVVDDGGRKLAKLQAFFGTTRPGANLSLTGVESGSEARDLLRREFFDLLILDILLPWRAKETPSEKGSSRLLEDIVFDEELVRPGQIVGLTADLDAARVADPIFAAKMWTVLRYDETGTGWLETIGASVDYMARQPSQAATYGVDLLIITALRDPEMDAVHKLPWNWQAEEPLDDATFIRRGAFLSNGKQFSVVTSVADRMGMVSAAVLATKAITLLKPRFCVMVGICAGIEKHTRLGDVLLADPAWDYQSGKRIKQDDGSHAFKIAPHQLDVSQFVRSRAKQLALDHNRLAEVRRDWPDYPGHDLRLLVGPIATGSAVLADSDSVVEVQEQQRQVIGIEMEVYGVYSAAAHSGFPKPTAFALKAVSDFADENKNDSNQKYASYTSAAVMREFFERYMHELFELAGM